MSFPSQAPPTAARLVRTSKDVSLKEKGVLNLKPRVIWLNCKARMSEMLLIVLVLVLQRWDERYWVREQPWDVREGQYG